jgi:hypothetical protein
MKLRTYVFVFFSTFLGVFALSGCLNEDNKIPPNCYDGILNNGEEFLDCGGPNCDECNHCINGRWEPSLGESWVDCGGECPVCSPCYNGIQDGDEVGIDCGGTCGRPCTALCNDGLLNGQEEQVDCGGACDACPTCTDGELNGDEVGIDCGGIVSDCSPCATDGSCINGVRDGDEYWVDCGGTTCPSCKDTLFWSWPQSSGGFNFSPTIITDVTFAANVLTIDGLTPGGQTFQLNLAKPPTGWASVVNIAQPLNAETAALGSVLTIQNEGIPYNSSVEEGDVDVVIQRYLLLPPPVNAEFFRISFSGTLGDGGGISLNVTGGTFMGLLN